MAHTRAFFALGAFVASLATASACAETTKTQFVEVDAASGNGGSAGQSSGGSSGSSGGTGGGSGGGGAGDTGGGGGIDGSAAGGGPGGVGGDSGASGSGGFSGVAGGGGAGGTDTTVIDFYERLCEASWVAALEPSSGATMVQCDAPLAGASARKLAAAQLEGNVAASNVLRITPPSTPDGVITGTFSGLSLVGVQNPYFVTTLGCPVSGSNCDFRWQFIVRYAGTSTGAPPVLDGGSEVLDGSAANLDLDLSAVAGAAIDVTFAVMANGGSSVEDIALWVHPRIVDRD